MHEVDSDTWSRSIVATLGTDTVGASRKGGMDNADGATPARSLDQRSVETG